MMADLKPYPAMKESGVPWLGKVPKHWATLPKATTMFCGSQRAKSLGIGEMLSVTITRGVTRKA